MAKGLYVVKNYHDFLNTKACLVNCAGFHAGSDSKTFNNPFGAAIDSNGVLRRNF